MKTAILSELAGRMRARTAAESTTDAELLERFVADRDEQAFSTIVRRHGPQVLGLCRRVTGDHHLAEDAFQSVFVVLAAKASSVRPRAVLPAWLYGVAYRIALRARTMQDRRRRRETTVQTLPEAALPSADGAETDLIAALDAEIAGLPESQRVPVVMCELEGRSRKEAAGDLGITEGTLSSRLARARKVLAVRLRRRGISLSAAGLTASLAQLAPARVREQLSTAVVAGAIGRSLPPAPVADLAQGALRVMLIQKLKNVAFAAGLLVVALIVTERLVAAIPAVAVESVAPAPPGPAVQQAPNKVLLFRDGHLVLLNPDGSKERKLTKERLKFYRDARLSPDGKQIAYLVLDQEGNVREALAGTQKLFVRSLDENGPGVDLQAECKMFAWSPDGTEIVCNQFSDGPKQQGTGHKHFIVDVKTKKQTPLDLPDGHFINDWSRDGKYFLTSSFVPNERQSPGSVRLKLMNRNGTENKTLTEEGQFCVDGRLSPDGKKVLYGLLAKLKEGEEPKVDLSVLDIATGKSTVIPGSPPNGELLGFSWSPDSKRIAYTWREGGGKDPKEKETKSRLVVCDPDGRNAKTIATQAGNNPTEVTIGRVDWR
jgi:RNA polymerase sigma factor (sigma-70 family)